MTIRNKTLNFANLFEGDKILWSLLFVLCIVSILEVYSASSTMTFTRGAYWSPVLKHSMFIGIGILATWTFHKIPPRYLGHVALGGILFSLVMLAMVMLYGRSLNDTHRWVTVGGFTLQPSEFAKGFLVMLVAVLLSYFRDERGATLTAFKSILLVTGIICMFIVTENLSTALLTAFVVLMMMVIGQVHWKPLCALIAITAVVGGSGYAILKYTPESILTEMENKPVVKRIPTWAHRIRNHVDFPDDPHEYDLNINPQITQSQIAIALNNVIGRGPGNSIVRDVLPQAYSDFIFAIILEELGIAGGFIVMFVYIVLLFRAGQIAQQCDSYMPTFMLMGLALLIAVQALINISVAVGFFPVTGQTLPLVSKGGSSIIATCINFGIMINISRFAQKKSKQTPEKATRRTLPASAA